MLLLTGFTEVIFTTSNSQMKRTNKGLGAIAMMASPFLFLQMTTGNEGNDYNSAIGGFFDLLYMIGWMCSIVGLQRLQVFGTKRTGNILLQVQLGFLFLANIWNVWVIFDPGNKSNLFFTLDMCWPLSNLCLFIIGVSIFLTGKLRGWKRYVVLFSGLWLPVAFGSMMLFGRTNTSLFIGGIHSTIAWFLMGWMIYTSIPQEENELRIIPNTSNLSSPE